MGGRCSKVCRDVRIKRRNCISWSRRVADKDIHDDDNEGNVGNGDEMIGGWQAMTLDNDNDDADNDENDRGGGSGSDNDAGDGDENVDNGCRCQLDER